MHIDGEFTATVGAAFTIIVIALLVAGLPLIQLTLLVITTVITSLFAKDELV